MGRKKILVTGGAGFIGSHFVRLALSRGYEVTNLDALRYSGNLKNLEDVEENTKYLFIHGDICRPDEVRKAIEGCSFLVNFAAETHVDRAILAADVFVRTDVVGT
ncbi:unnamed protein product, partial [marine sediment metagenome]